MAAPSKSLQKEMGLVQLFTMAFGTIVGVGWVVALGGWLDLAGPLGAALAFLAGGLIVMMIALCYAEMAAMFPFAGGEVAYAHEVFGIRYAFLVGWFLALAFIVVTSFEAISMTWILSALFPWGEGPRAYSFLGSDVSVADLVIGMGTMLFLTIVNYRGARSSARFQDLVTYSLLIMIAVFIGSGISLGDPGHLQPLFREDGARPIWSGILGVLATAPFWFSGFQVIPQVIEERSPGMPLSRLGKLVMLAIGLAIVFYCGVIISSSMAIPWPDLLSRELPASEAFRAGLRLPILGNVVLFSALLGVLTTWNAIFVAAARILFALGRAQIIHPVFGRVHSKHGSPAFATVFVGVLGGLGILLGRSGITPIVNVSATCMSLGFVITCLALLRLRRIDPARERPYAVPGGSTLVSVGAVAAVLMFAFSLYEPYAAAGSIFSLEWGVLVVWSVCGVLIWTRSRLRRESLSHVERSNLILGNGKAVLD